MTHLRIAGSRLNGKQRASTLHTASPVGYNLATVILLAAFLLFDVSVVDSASFGDRGQLSTHTVSEPNILIPTEFPATLNERVTLPIRLESNGASVASVAFSIEFASDCLHFDDQDGDDDGLADNISSQVPTSFSVIAQQRTNANITKIDLLISDVALPFAALPDGNLVALTLDATCSPSELGVVPIDFSADPSISFGSTSAQNIGGTATSGSIRITIATPTSTPTHTPTHTPTSTPTHTSTHAPTPTDRATQIPTATQIATATATPPATLHPTTLPTSTQIATVSATATTFFPVTPAATATIAETSTEIATVPATVPATETVFDVATKTPAATMTSTPTAMPTNTSTLADPPATRDTTLDEEDDHEDKVVPALLSHQPLRSTNNVAISVNLFGKGFTPDSTIQLLPINGGAPLVPYINYVSSGHLIAKLPIGARTGDYRFRINIPDYGSVDGGVALTIQDVALLNDLRADPAFFWTKPFTARADEPLEFGLTIERVGGEETLYQLPVRFWSTDGVEPSNHVDSPLSIAEIGRTLVNSMTKNDSKETTPLLSAGLSAGEHTLWAEIDPEQNFLDTDRTNNVISRTITILPQVSDTEPPSIDRLTMNGHVIWPAGTEAEEEMDLQSPSKADDASLEEAVDGGNLLTVNQREVELTLLASDADSGVAHMAITEMNWNIGAKMWSIGQTSGWLPYTETLTWSLHPDAGIRFFSIWVADAAGNIRPQPVVAQVNFMPTEDFLIPGESRLYRTYVDAESCLTVHLTPAYGDPDLYVWGPSNGPDNDVWYSINGDGQDDRLSITTQTAGFYQIEIEGWSETQFELAITTTDDVCEAAVETIVETPSGTAVLPPSSNIAGQARIGQGSGAIGLSANERPAEKTIRHEPYAPVDTAPPRLVNLEPVPAGNSTTRVYLPLLR